MKPRCLMVLGLLVVSACDSGPKAPPPDLIQGQRQALDKAKGVGEVLQQSVDQRREREDKGK
jgi:hypothetical protein